MGETVQASQANPDELAELVLGSFPHPIALAFENFCGEEDPTLKFRRGLDLVETTMHFLLAVLSAAYFEGDSPTTKIDRHFLELLRKPKWVLGDLSKTIDLLSTEVSLPGCPPFPKSFRKQCAEFVELRNKKWGHAPSYPRSHFEDQLRPLEDSIKNWFEHLRKLSHFTLFSPSSLNPDGSVETTTVLIGREPKHDVATGFLYPPGNPRPFEAGPSKTLFFVHEEESLSLPLTPFAIFQPGLNSSVVCFLQGVTESNRRTKTANFRHLDPDEEQVVEREGTGSVKVITSLTNAIRRRLSHTEEHDTTGDTDADTVSFEATDYELREVTLEQRSHTEHCFPGRDKFISEVNDWRECHPEGGYLLLTGPPGQGKSALMANIAKRESRVLGQFVLLHMIKSHTDPRRFLPALIAQAGRVEGIQLTQDDVVGDIRDLRSSLVGTLEQIVENGKERCLLLIDALDELPTEHRESLEFLPPNLPCGVHAVLTTRPDVPLTTLLRQRLGNPEELEVPPLCFEDFKEVLNSMLGDVATNEIVKRHDLQSTIAEFEGNALLVRQAARSIKRSVENAGGHDSLTTLDIPRTVNQMFAQVYREIETRQAHEGKHDVTARTALLKILCCAQDEMSFADLRGATACNGALEMTFEQCRKHCEKMSQYLLETRRGYVKPWHKGLADFVKDEILGADDTSRCHGQLATFALKFPDSEYVITHGVTHLLDEGKDSEAAKRLTDPCYLEQVSSCGQLSKLPSEMNRCFNAIGKDTSRGFALNILSNTIRSELHFLGAHPHLLFQVLWNHIAWYCRITPYAGSGGGTQGREVQDGLQSDQVAVRRRNSMPANDVIEVLTNLLLQWPTCGAMHQHCWLECTTPRHTPPLENSEITVYPDNLETTTNRISDWDRFLLSPDGHQLIVQDGLPGPPQPTVINVTDGTYKMLRVPAADDATAELSGFYAAATMCSLSLCAIDDTTIVLRVRDLETQTIKSSTRVQPRNTRLEHLLEDDPPPVFDTELLPTPPPLFRAIDDRWGICDEKGRFLCLALRQGGLCCITSHTGEVLCLDTSDTCVPRGFAEQGRYILYERVASAVGHRFQGDVCSYAWDTRRNTHSLLSTIHVSPVSLVVLGLEQDERDAVRPSPDTTRDRQYQVICAHPTQPEAYVATVIGRDLSVAAFDLSANGAERWRVSLSNHPVCGESGPSNLLVSCSRKSKRVAIAGSGCVALLETEQGECIDTVHNHRDIYGLVVLPDGDRLAIWELARAAIRVFPASPAPSEVWPHHDTHRQPISAGSFSPDDSFFISWAGDERIGVWDVVTGDVKFRRFDSKIGAAPAIEWITDDQIVFRADSELLCCSYDSSTKSLTKSWSVPCKSPPQASWTYPAAIPPIAISPCGGFIAATPEDDLGRCRIIDTATGTTIRQLEACPGQFTHLGWSTDGQDVIGVGVGLVVFNASDGCVKRKITSENENLGHSFINKNGRYGLVDGILWDIELSRKHAWQIEPPPSVYMYSWDTDGTYFVRYDFFEEYELSAYENGRPMEKSRIPNEIPWDLRFHEDYEIGVTCHAAQISVSSKKHPQEDGLTPRSGSVFLSKNPRSTLLAVIDGPSLSILGLRVPNRTDS